MSEATSEDIASSTEPQYDTEHVSAHAELAEDMLIKIGKLVSAEVDVSSEDYKLLEKMNISSAARYEQMASQATTMLTLMQQLLHKQPLLESCFAEINKVHDQVNHLQLTVASLEKYVEAIELHIDALLESENR